MLNTSVKVGASKDTWPLIEQAERTNFLRLMEQCEKLGLYDQILELWHSVNIQLWQFGFRSDTLTYAHIALRAADKLGNSLEQGAILNELGWFFMERDEFGIARKYFLQALEQYIFADSPFEQSIVIRDIGTLFFRERRVGPALQHYKQALHIIHTSENSGKVRRDKPVYL